MQYTLNLATFYKAYKIFIPPWFSGADECCRSLYYQDTCVSACQRISIPAKSACQHTSVSAFQQPLYQHASVSAFQQNQRISKPACQMLPRETVGRLWKRNKQYVNKMKNTFLDHFYHQNLWNYSEKSLKVYSPFESPASKKNTPTGSTRFSSFNSCQLASKSLFRTKSLRPPAPWIFFKFFLLQKF